MTKEKNIVGILDGNTLKILAAIFMVIDHIGVIFFPDVIALRIIGRLAFPIFAFMIAEGCRYTKNKKRYLLIIALLAAICQITYYIYDGSTYMNILVTFSLSIVLIYILQGFKKSIIENISIQKKTMFAVIFLIAVIVVYFVNTVLIIDYGFWGCMVPVFASAFHFKDIKSRFDCNLAHVLTLGLGLLILAIDMGGVQYYSLLALPLLMLYSTKKGKRNIKYFFYAFYPLHLLVLQGVYLLINEMAII